MQSEPKAPKTVDDATPFVCPGSVEDLRTAVTSVQGDVLAFGAGTRLAFANAAQEPELRVSTRRLRSVLHYEPADMTIAVEAGMTLGEVNRVLGEHNQMLPLDAYRPDEATLGGLFASGLAGPRRFKYGSLRDWTLGLEVMDPHGVITKSGGMVVKNVTGYDMPRLHHGAHGAFGIVTRLNLKVLPREQATRSVLLLFGTASAAFDAASAVIRSQKEPTSVTVTRDESWQLAVSCDGPSSTIDAQAGAIAEAAQVSTPAEDVRIHEGPNDALYGFQATVDTSVHRAVARLSVPAGKQLDVVSRLAALSSSFICADPGSGLVYISGLPSLEWRNVVRSVAQASVFLTLPNEFKKGIDVFGPIDAHSMRLLKRLKAEFDPDRRLNRGRFISGI